MRRSFFIEEENGGCIFINDLMINEEIRDREVRVVNQQGEQLGIMPTAQALKLAEEQQLDLKSRKIRRSWRRKRYACLPRLKITILT